MLCDMSIETKNIQLQIPFSSPREAKLVYEVLNVDKELKGIKRELSTDGAELIVNFEGEDLKKLRVSVNGFLQSIKLVTKTMACFP
ncbi:unnamed protein product [Leptidea sinapis]|uniref:L antigen family member 3 n=1 Tax=Leptidea sinapis TaxID=189913 RepID=A0A5E4PQU8_9NEOP|nr:unnamed protein product [Leptidea sinapis]